MMYRWNLLRKCHDILCKLNLPKAECNSCSEKDLEWAQLKLDHKMIIHTTSKLQRTKFTQTLCLNRSKRLSTYFLYYKNAS